MTEMTAAYGEPKSPIDVILAHRAQVESETPGWVENPVGERKRADNVGVLAALEDEVVLKLFREACEVSGVIQRLQDTIATRIDEYRDLAATEHGVKWRSQIGNRSVQSRDGLVRIQIKQGCLYHIDPAVQDAQALVLGCAARWGEGAAEEANIESLAANAFSAREGGGLSRARLGLLLDFKPANPDPEWDRAMDMIRKAIHVAARKQSIQVQWRPTQKDAWRNLPLSMLAPEAVPAKSTQGD